MKKISIIIVIVLSINNLFGQFDFNDFMQIGVSGGYNLSTVDFQPKINQTSIGGINTGFIINYFAEKNVGIQLEVNYAQRGWKDNDVATVGNYERTMNYIEIPLLAHASWAIGKFRVQLDVGPYLAFHNSFSENYDPSGIPDDLFTKDTLILGERTYYGQKVDNEMDYGFIVGLGPAFSTKFGEFQLRIRYVQGMQSIFKQYPEGNFRFTQMRTIHAGFAYVYTIPVKKKKNYTKQTSGSN